MSDIVDRKGSVTRTDFLTSPDQGVFAWTIYDPGAMASPVPTLPIHGSRERDRILTATLDLEDMWASAIDKAVTKIAVRGYEVSDNDDSTRRTEYGQSLARDLDGPASYRSGMSKVVQDFLLTDNGWFMEVQRAGGKPSGKVQGLYPLDSFRCYRTGNLDYPVVYLDWESTWHKLRYDQVIFGSDMPSPRSRMWSRGRCAASRAFATIIKLGAVDTYFREKITGSRALALQFITGVSRQQLQDAMETGELEKTRKGHVVYKGVVMIPIQTDQPINVATVDLASVPDGFDVEQVQADGYKKYAMAIGLNPDELVARAAGLNSGQSAQVSEQAAEESGALAFFVKDFEDKLNHLVMPKPTIFQLTTNDTRDKQMAATLNKTIADTIAVMRGSPQAPGWINDQMALQIAVDEGIVPPEFLPEDVTPAGLLTDSGDQSKAPAPTPRAPYAGQTPPPPPAPAPGAPPAMKERAMVTYEGVDHWLNSGYVQDTKATKDAGDGLGFLERARAFAAYKGWPSMSDDDLLKRYLVGEKATKDDDEWAEAVKWAEEASKAPPAVPAKPKPTTKAVARQARLPLVVAREINQLKAEIANKADKQDFALVAYKQAIIEKKVDETLKD